MVLRLNITDSKTGICLFEKISTLYGWSGPSVTDGICKLVLTFHKISKEVGDTGDVGGVVFDPQEFSRTPTTSTPINTSASSSSGSLHERTHKRTKSGVQPQIKLVSEKDDTLAVSVFHTQGEEFGPVREFVVSVKQEFTRVHGREVASLRSTLDAIADAAANNKPPASAGMKPEAILFRFEKFAANVEALREKGGL